MILLDTHAFFWFITDDPNLPQQTKELIECEESVFVSTASFWEMAIKESIGKLKLPVAVSKLMYDCAELEFTILPINGHHMDRLKSLPKIHGDPFDRIIICQAQEENLKIITRDQFFPQYDVDIFWK